MTSASECWDLHSVAGFRLCLRGQRMHIRILGADIDNVLDHYWRGVNGVPRQVAPQQGAVAGVESIGSSAFPVFSNVDPPGNQCRRALEDVSPKKSSLTHSVDVHCLSRPILATFFLLLSTGDAEEPKFGMASKGEDDKHVARIVKPLRKLALHIYTTSAERRTSKRTESTC